MKNPRFGLGLKQAVIARHDRRDALFLLAVLAHTLLTLLGKAGQELGMDRMLGATRPGHLSLFRQGLMLFELIPTMREDRLRALANEIRRTAPRACPVYQHSGRNLTTEGMPQLGRGSLSEGKKRRTREYYSPIKHAHGTLTQLGDQGVSPLRERVFAVCTR